MPRERGADCTRVAVERRYWVGVASHDHVLAAARGGFCQLGHGKEAPVRRLGRGDRIVFYSPREGLGTGAPLRAFTAAGQIMDDAPYEARQALQFHPFRRKTAFFHIQHAPIQPLLDALTFTRGRDAWGLSFRRSVLLIAVGDFTTIANAMKIDLTELDPR